MFVLGRRRCEKNDLGLGRGSGVLSAATVGERRTDQWIESEAWEEEGTGVKPRMVIWDIVALSVRSMDGFD